MAAIDLNSVRSTIESRLEIELANGPPVPIVFNNIPYGPDAGKSWCQCLVNFGQNEYLTLGGSGSSENLIVGVVVFNIFTPSGVGPGANLIIGKRIRDLYNRVIVSRIYFDPPSGPSFVSASPEGYLQSQIRVTFEVVENL